ncbi:MAG: hypothetical protein ACTSQJ_12410 [Promethearchaeota archaeon]
MPLICFGAYASIFIFILNDISSFTFEIEPPDKKNFFSLKEINMSKLNELALNYEQRLEKYFIPGNMIPVDATFEDRNYNKISSWSGTDNGALHTGEALLAECLRYKYALDNNNEEELNNATRIVKKLVQAFSDMIAAPNGGIGINPDTGKWYPGTLSRFVCAPQYRNVHPWMFEDNPRHFNGTGKYHNWRVRLYTSRDEVAGYYLMMASVLKFIDPKVNEDSKWCVDRVKTLVEQIIEGFRKTNWLIINGDGNPTGSDLNAYLEGSTWQLTLLRIGATANPQKYQTLYNYAASRYLSMNNAQMGSLWNADEDYYAFSFGAHTIFSLIILEDNPLLQYHYIKNFEKKGGFYDIVKFHRNAYFNIIHLAFMSLLDKKQKEQFENPEYDFGDIRHDVLDQLYRFYKSGWADGIRNYNLTDRPHSTRSTSLNSEIRKKELDSSKIQWRKFFENSLFGSLYSWIGEDLFNFENEHYLLPRTVSETGAGHFFWGSNPFYGEGGDPSGNGLHEAPALCFTTVYWMGKAYDIF